MSKIRLYGSTSGYVDLAAPAVADDATLTLPTGAAGFGKALQVVSTTKTDTFTTTSTTPVDVTGLAVTITPTSATSKVLVVAQVAMTGIFGAANAVFMRLDGGGSDAFVGDAASSRTRALSYRRRQQSIHESGMDSFGVSAVYLSSPATTNAVTYKVQAWIGGGGGTGYINRSGDDVNDSTYGRTASSITAIEVAS